MSGPDPDDGVVDDDQRRGQGLGRAAQQRVVDDRVTCAACRARRPTASEVIRFAYCGKATRISAEHQHRSAARGGA